MWRGRRLKVGAHKNNAVPSDKGLSIKTETVKFLLKGNEKYATYFQVKGSRLSGKQIIENLTACKDIDIEFVDSREWYGLYHSVIPLHMDRCLPLSYSKHANANISIKFHVTITDNRQVRFSIPSVEHGDYLNHFERLANDYLRTISPKRRIHIYKVLLREGIGSQSIWFQNTLFLSALHFDELNEVKSYIEMGGVDIHCLNSDFRLSNIVHEATRFGCTKVLRYLLESTDIDIDFQDENGKTPISFAVLTGSVPCLKELLAAGAKAQIPDKTGRTPLYCAVFFSALENTSNSSAMISLLLQSPSYNMTDVKHVLTSVAGIPRTCTSRHDGEDAENRQIMKERLSRQYTLKQLCIGTILSHLGQRPSRKIFSLKLPRQLITEILHTLSDLYES